MLGFKALTFKGVEELIRIIEKTELKLQGWPGAELVKFKHYDI